MADNYLTHGWSFEDEQEDDFNDVAFQGVFTRGLEEDGY